MPLVRPQCSRIGGCWHSDAFIDTFYLMKEIFEPLAGGCLIGISVTLMLWLNGRVTGVSGIVNGILRPTSNDGVAWRWAFIAGLLLGGLVLAITLPEKLSLLSGRPWPLFLASGFLVGLGTVIGGGCTSGHGVCGVSRLSIRSIVATVTFILFGMLSVALLNYLRNSL
jgi:uncharacterized protein